MNDGNKLANCNCSLMQLKYETNISRCSLYILSNMFLVYSSNITDYECSLLVAILTFKILPYSNPMMFYLPFTKHTVFSSLLWFGQDLARQLMQVFTYLSHGLGVLGGWRLDPVMMGGRSSGHGSHACRSSHGTAGY